MADDQDDAYRRVKRVFHEHHRRLVLFAWRILGDRFEAEDVVQDIFLKLWNKLDVLSDQESVVKVFLYKAVKNASLNVIRHRRHVLSHLATQEAEPSEDNLLQNLLQVEVLAELHRAIDSLPEFCRNVSRMAYLEGKKNQEVADALGVSIDSVKAQKQRAKKLLRLKLNPELLGLLFLLPLK